MNRPRSVAFGILVVVAIGLIALGAWRLEIQRVNLVIVNQSGHAGQFSWQPSLFAALETIPVQGCESKSMTLRGGEDWRFEADNLDVNSNFLDRPWLTPMVALEIWIDPGGSSRIVGPRAVDAPVGAPYPSACAVTP